MTLLYPTGDAFRGAARKRLLLFGMSGLGKTHLSAMLRDTGDWFHYSADYRIGTRYLGEAIADEFKAEAMRVPRLAALLRSDSIYVASNLTFENLAPLSGWVGMPGDPARGGLTWEEWRRRQDLHRAAEVAAMEDTAHFAERAGALYGYPHFVCDASGSLCEVTGPGDPLLDALAAGHLMVWIDGDEAHADTLTARFDRAPKPMYYRPEIVAPIWEEHMARAGGDALGGRSGRLRPRRLRPRDPPAAPALRRARGAGRHGDRRGGREGRGRGRVRGSDRRGHRPPGGRRLGRARPPPTRSPCRSASQRPCRRTTSCGTRA